MDFSLDQGQNRQNQNNGCRYYRKCSKQLHRPFIIAGKFPTTKFRDVGALNTTRRYERRKKLSR